MVVKPSEVSEHTSQMIANILPQYLDPVSAVWCLAFGYICLGFTWLLWVRVELFALYHQQGVGQRERNI